MPIDTTPYWLTDASLPQFGKLESDATADVVVIGGGVTGITAAYLLARAGHTVALIERGRLAAVDTAHTTAHLTHVTDLRLTELESSFGREAARAVWDAGRAGLWQIEANIDAEGIDDCDFRWVNGYLHAPTGQRQGAAVDFAAEAALAVELGFEAHVVDRTPLIGRAGVEYGGQALFHPRRYLRGLIEAIVDAGGRIFEHTSAESVEDSPLAVTVGKHRLSCGYVVIATHTPIVGKASLLSAALFQTKLALYTSYAVGGKAPAGSLEAASYWDTADPYDYLRIHPARDYDYVILGGEDHKTGQVDTPDQCYARLRERLTALVPAIEVTHHWSGQVIETADGLPYIGESAGKQFVATGFSGNGWTFGTLAAMMATDAVSGRVNPWTALFDPARKKIKDALWDYLTENKDYPYYLIRDRFSTAEGRSLRVLGREQGMLLDLDGVRTAAYRDAEDRVTRLSPVCTHMGCHVAWNRSERTWDCPCHGSRFAPTGAVIAGPAETPLEKL